MSRYTFGHNALAAERLELVAATFDTTSRNLLEQVRPHLVRCRRIADLGCGPGFTTELLHQLFPEAAIVAIDVSPDFAALASARVPAADVRVGDALALDGDSSYDLIYARYLLAHLGDVEAAIHTWCVALAPGGLLVLEEPESIASTDADFARYEAISCELVQARGGVFYAGPLIAHATLPNGVEPLIDEAIVIDVTAGEAAAMFWRNIAVWGDDAVAVGLADANEIDGLVTRMRARQGDTTRGLFEWRQRQAAFSVTRSG